MEQELVEYDKYEDRLNATKSGVQNIFVDIGESCFVQAEVEETNVKKAFVHIGLGNYVQFDTPAALELFIEKRREFLTRKIEYMKSRIELMGADVEQVRRKLVMCPSSIPQLSRCVFVDEADAGSIGSN